MAVISEDDEGGVHVLPTNFSELLELPETALTDSDDVLAGSTGPADSLRPTCPAHSHATEYVGPSRSIKSFTDLLCAAAFAMGSREIGTYQSQL